MSCSLHHGQSSPCAPGSSGTWTERSENHNLCFSNILLSLLTRHGRNIYILSKIPSSYFGQANYRFNSKPRHSVGFSVLFGNSVAFKKTDVFFCKSLQIRKGRPHRRETETKTFTEALVTFSGLPLSPSLRFWLPKNTGLLHVKLLVSRLDSQNMNAADRCLSVRPRRCSVTPKAVKSIAFQFQFQCVSQLIAGQRRKAANDCRWDGMRSANSWLKESGH